MPGIEHPLPKGTWVQTNALIPTDHGKFKGVAKVAGEILAVHRFSGYTVEPYYYAVLWSDVPAPEGSGRGQIVMVWAKDVTAVVTPAVNEGVTP